MTNSNDSEVDQILAEIDKHGWTAGVTFRQSAATTRARYSTKAVLTAVRKLADEAEANHSPMAAELRAMLDTVDPDLPIQIEFPASDALSAKDDSLCITEIRSAHGYYWRYIHSPDAPPDALETALTIASDVAATEARKSGKTYLVASTSQPSPAVYVFAFDHPDASNDAIDVLFEFTPAGAGCLCVRSRSSRRLEARRQRHV